ncbi:MAG: sigma-54-dependent Fis family transcriptional regulator [Deltaproteobacteria bacterium]|nr:sigma-54-dependent Fis family transcriptional regulator [Deltaproteobacteria bacterium]
MRSVLIIDDELSIQQSLLGALGDEGYRVSLASNGKEGLETLRKSYHDAVLLDIWMSELDGIETLKLIKSEWPSLIVIMMSGHGTIETAVRATKLGAFDFLEKPLSLERLLVILQNAWSLSDLRRENQALRSRVEKTKFIVGCSQAMKQIQEVIEKVAPTMGSVLITGENGTGKELIAQSIHAHSQRFNKPFITVNCAAIPEELIESELFGHEKGAFTGATQLRRGKFDLANGGTLFLDEIGDMSFKTQAKILRILQEQKFERIGGSEVISIDVRIIAATNKDLKAAIQNGLFREDLFYRLNVIPIQLPPIRDRKEDITILAEHFINEFSTAYQRKKRELTQEAISLLMSYQWPGNVRELRNLIERVMILTHVDEDGLPISVGALLENMKEEYQTISIPMEISKSESQKLKDARQEFEKQFILKTLNEQEWNVSKTADVLDVERSHLHKKIKTYGIEM